MSSAAPPRDSDDALDGEPGGTTSATRRGHVRLGVPRLPPGALRRDRLLPQLAQRPALTVLRAPSGFGKSVAVAHWLGDASGPDEPAIWLRADPTLQSAAFWGEIAHMLGEVGIEVQATGAAPHRCVQSAIRRWGSPLTLVVDDADSVLDRSLEKQLVDLARACHHMHLVVCLHSSQHFASSIRATVPTMLIEAPQLAFTAGEIAELIPAEYRARFPTWAAELHRCAGGWPDLTRAALLALQDDPRQSVDDAAAAPARSILFERVLGAFEGAAWMRFAVDTAIPERLTVPAAEHASGDTDARDRLRQLERAGAVTATVHRGEPSYRWPDATRRVLVTEALRRDRTRVLRQHRDLAALYLAREDIPSAAVHAARSGDQALAVSVVEEHWGRLLHEDLAALDMTLAAIPLPHFRRSPRAAAARDIRMRVLGEVADSLVLGLPDPLPTGERALVRLARSGQADAALRTGYALMVAMRMRGMAAAALDYAGRTEAIGRAAVAHQPADVWQYLPTTMLGIGITRLIFDDPTGAAESLQRAFQSSASARGGFIRRDAAGKLALLHALRGSPARAEAWLERHRAAPASSGELTARIDRSGLQARTLVCIDRLDRAGVAEMLPLLDATFSEEENWLPFTSYIRARAALLWGDHHGAAVSLSSDLERLAPWVASGSTMGPMIAGALADLHLSLRMGGLARQVVDAVPPHRSLQPARARLALMTGDIDAARGVADQFGPGYSVGARTELLLVAAVARHRGGEDSAATALLGRAIGIARQTGSLFPFTTVPRDDLLRIAASTPGAQQFVMSAQLDETPSPFTETVAIIELTVRERAVLGCLANGDTLAETARGLYVSYNTVKSQVRTLYAKLGVSSRSEALAQARRHGLLRDPTTASR